MIKDISKIREELKDHIEIELPYYFKKNCYVKYITLKNEEESFYIGGHFVSYGNDSILLKKNNRTWCVPTCYRNKDGGVKYKTRFFILENLEDIICDKKVKELNDSINFQKSIIEKLTEELKDLEIHKKQLLDTVQEYEELLQQNRYHLKDLSIKLREKDEKIIKYEDIIQKLSYSHPLINK